MKTLLIYALLLVTTSAYAQFTVPALDSGMFYLRVYEMVGDEDVTYSCDRVELRYYFYGAQYGFFTHDEGEMLQLTPANATGTIGQDADGGKWLAEIGVGESSDPNLQFSTFQHYRRVSQDTEYYMVGPHYVISDKNICQEDKGA